eukprot:92485-Pyramimonas_sp.AAC.1
MGALLAALLVRHELFAVGVHPHYQIRVPQPLLRGARELLGHDGHDGLLVLLASLAMQRQGLGQVKVGHHVPADEDEVPPNAVALIDETQRVPGRCAVAGGDGVDLERVHRQPARLQEVGLDLIRVRAAEHERLQGGHAREHPLSGPSGMCQQPRPGARRQNFSVQEP